MNVTMDGWSWECTLTDAIVWLLLLSDEVMNGDRSIIYAAIHEAGKTQPNKDP